MTYAGAGGADAGLPPRSISNVPVPDPSTLTQEALEREISHLRELLESQVAIVAKELDNFKTGLEDRYQTNIKESIQGLKSQVLIRTDDLQAQLDAKIKQVDQRYNHRYEEVVRLMELMEEKAGQLHVETDLRYQQRYDAQTKALTEKDQVQQAAISAALVQAEKGVASALAAVDKATIKTEIAVSERFKDMERQIDSRFANEETKLNTALSTVDKATIKAEGVTLHRFEVVEQQVGKITQISDTLASITARIEGLDRLTDSKFITLRTLVDTQAEKVALALTASDKAVCVSADTPILCADLVWRPAGDLLPGDELIAFDEEPLAFDPSTRNKRLDRRNRKAQVISNSLQRDSLLRVTTPKGSVRCNAEHPWLTRDPRRHGGKWRGNKWQWVRTDELESGMEVLHAFDVWEPDHSFEAGWLSGFLDGEGSLHFDKVTELATLSVPQCVGLTCDHIESALKSRVDSCKGWLTPARKANHHDKMEFQVRVLADVMTLLGSVRPERLLVNSDRVWEGRMLSSSHRATVITNIESVGTGMIARLATTTQTYIANGFAMHNTKAEISTEKRFEADALIKQQLQEQGKTYVTRSESNVSINALTDKVTALTAQLAASIPRQEVEARLKSLSDESGSRWSGLDKKVDELRQNIAINLTGAKQGSSTTWAAIAGGIALLATIIGIIAFIAARSTGTTP